MDQTQSSAIGHLPGADEVPALPGPFEIWEHPSGAVLDVTIVRYQMGTIQINPGGRAPKTVVALRGFVTLGVGKKAYPDYWDFTAATLVPQLRAFLDTAKGRPVTFRIGRIGEGARSRFPVEVLP